MTAIKCKMCGGNVRLEAGKSYGLCEYCGSAMTLPRTADEHHVNLFNRANQHRLQNEFDKAMQVYENILNKDNTNAEAHWGVVLSRYGIEYVEDPATRRRVPTCRRLQNESLLADLDYAMALQYAPDEDTRKLYEQEAAAIYIIQKEILAVASRETPYDVFLCYKETAEDGERTIDSTIAQDIYYHLVNEGYKVFFARITLEDKLGQQYEPYIFSALNSARVMLVIGTKKEHFEAVWVKNEWTRFLALAKKDSSKLLIPCYRDMDAYDIPDALSHLQSQNMSKIGFLQDLLHGVKKVLASGKAVSPPTTVVVQTPPSRNKFPQLAAAVCTSITLLVMVLFLSKRGAEQEGGKANMYTPPRITAPVPRRTLAPVSPPGGALIDALPDPNPTDAPEDVPALALPEYIPPFRGNPSDFITNLEEQIELPYFEDNYEAVYGILEAAVPRIEFDNPNEHNVLYSILEMVCRHEDINALTLLAESGLDLNLCDNDGNPVLSEQTPSLDFLEQMIALGADPAQRSHYYRESALTRALKQNREPEALYLISLLTDEELTLPALAGATPLHMACENGLLEAAQALLDSGVDVEIKGFAPKTGFYSNTVYEGKTPLMTACEHIRADAVELLLQNGADAAKTDAKGNSLIHMTMAVGTDYSLSIPQQEALIDEQVEILSLLAEGGADVNAKAGYGTTPLMMLADSHLLPEERLMQALIRLGADPSRSNDGGQTPLHAVSVWGFDTTARFLILQGADVNAVDENGNTPLSIARRNNNDALISLYLSAGATE